MIQAHHFFLNLPVKDSSQEADFFKSLAFTELYPGLDPGTRLYSDGHLQLQLSPADGRRMALCLLTNQSVESLAAALQLSGLQTVIQDSSIQQVSPDGLAVHWLSLPDWEFPKQPPTGKTLCGAFGEISLETHDLKASRLFWEVQGFRKIMPEGDISNWMSMTNGLLHVGLYQKGSCPHPFRSPAITFFNKDARQQLESLQQQGFRFAWRMPADEGASEEAILESPEGYQLFLFKV